MEIIFSFDIFVFVYFCCNSDIQATVFLETEIIPKFASSYKFTSHANTLPNREDFEKYVDSLISTLSIVFLFIPLSLLLTPQLTIRLIVSMHRSGINLRYLGLVRQFCHEKGRKLLLTEMVARAMKHHLRKALREMNWHMRSESDRASEIDATRRGDGTTEDSAVLMESNNNNGASNSRREELALTTTTAIIPLPSLSTLEGAGGDHESENVRLTLAAIRAHLNQYFSRAFWDTCMRAELSRRFEGWAHAEEAGGVFLESVYLGSLIVRLSDLGMRSFVLSFLFRNEVVTVFY
jgi:hypothetical protein